MSDRRPATYREAAAIAVGLLGICFVEAGIGALIGWAVGATQWGFLAGAFAGMLTIVILMALLPTKA